MAGPQCPSCVRFTTVWGPHLLYMADIRGGDGDDSAGDDDEGNEDDEGYNEGGYGEEDASESEDD